ncbi:MAG: hypothetical protein WCP03_03280 [Candidatus Saccharibacteria bacterium]
MQNQNTQPGSSSEYDSPKNESENSLANRINEKISTVKNWINETIHPKDKQELESQTGDALAHIAEETIEASKESGDINEQEKSEIIDAVGAAAEQTIYGELVGQPNNPIETLDKDGHGQELIETIVEIAKTDRPMAEELAEEVDRVEGFVGKPEEAAENSTDSSEKTKESYEDKIERLKRNNETSVELFFTGGELNGLNGLEQKQLLDNPENWESTRSSFHTEIFNKAHEDAIALSERLKKYNPIITMYVLRGNTASGKTRAVKTDEMFDGILDENNNPTGAINPDRYKLDLRQGEVDISAAQVHIEGSMISRKVERHLKRPDISIVLDKRNETQEDINKILSNATETERAIRILDVDVPLETSLVGVLMRPRGGEDPNVPFYAIAEGFIGIRANREGLLDTISQDNGTKIDGYKLMAFDPSEHRSVVVATLEGGSIKVAQGKEKLLTSITIEYNKEELESIAEATGNTIINDSFIENYCANYIEGDENGRQYAQKVANKLSEFKGKTLRRAVDIMANGSSVKEGANYLKDANRNLLATSRTANGTVDTSASSTKAESMVDIDGNEAAEKAKNNFDATISSLFEKRDKDFSTPEDMKDFVEGVAAQINDGIVKEGSLIRDGVDSDKYPYTRLENLPDAMQQFYTELQQKLSDPDSDPIETAAFCEYRIDLVDHFFADGCGKAAKAMSSYVLMRAGLPLPQYKGGRKEYYQHAPTKIAGSNPAEDQAAWQNFLGYYKTMLGGNK